MNYFRLVSIATLLIVVTSPQMALSASETRTLTVCTLQPDNPYQLMYGNNSTVKAGKVTDNTGKINTTTCQTKRFNKGKQVMLHARTVRLKPQHTSAYHQSGFHGWSNSGEILNPRGGSEAKVNACNGLGAEPVCMVKMNRNRRVRANFQLFSPMEFILWGIENDDFPICRMLGTSQNARHATCILGDRYTINVDRSADGQVEPADEVTEVYYELSGCSGQALIEDAVVDHIFWVDSRRVPGQGVTNQGVKMQWFTTYVDADDRKDTAASVWSDSRCVGIGGGMRLRAAGEVRWLDKDKLPFYSREAFRRLQINAP